MQTAIINYLRGSGTINAKTSNPWKQLKACFHCRTGAGTGAGARTYCMCISFSTTGTENSMKLSNRKKCYYYKGTVYFPYLKARSKTAGLEFAAQVITTTGTADLQT